MVAITVTALTPGTRALASVKTQRGIRGAFLNLPYVGPAKVASGGHVTLADLGGGGTEDSKAYRTSDSFDLSGQTGGLTGGPATSVTRPSRYRYGPGATTVQAYIGAGVQGGSAPGLPVDLSGRAVDAGVDRFGRARGVANVGAGLGMYTYTNFDSRTPAAGAEGSGAQEAGGGRGTVGPSDTSGTVTRSVSSLPSITTDPRPVVDASVASGNVGIVDGTTGIMQVDLDAADITGGASGRKGAEVAVFARGADTDEDGRLLFFGSVDGGTDVSTLFTPGAGTYAVYARWRYPGKAPRSTAGAGFTLTADPRVIGRGPWSLRFAATIT